MEIQKFANCIIIQDDNGNYLVMSNNNICLTHVVNIVKAFEYAEWYETKEIRK